MNSINGYFLRRFSSTGSLPTLKQLRTRLTQHVESFKDGKTAVDSSDSLPSRCPKVSRDRAIVPLASDAKLRDEYVNFFGNIRLGLLLEDMDTFAGWLSYRHNNGGPLTGQRANHPPMAIVTACVDRINMHTKFTKADEDVFVEGEVSWVGRSSLETTMRLVQNDTLLMEAKFVMVAKSTTSNKTVDMRPLEPETEEEVERFKIGESNKKLRFRESQESLLKIPPSESESKTLHKSFLQTIDEQAHTFKHRVLPSGHVWIEDCKLKSVIICFPQQRNLYNKVFGGFIMRQAFELAWANAYAFGGVQPITLAVDDIMFRKPVEIGSLLYLSSQICYTNASLMEVRVHAQVVDTEKRSQQTTNTFHFTFGTADGRDVRRLMPKTYADGMLFLSGKRHLEETARTTRVLSS